MRTLRVLAAALSFLSLVAAAHGGTLDAIKQRGRLIAGVKADFPPFGFIDERGAKAGFDVDVVRELTRIVLGDPQKVELVVLTSANRIPMIQANQVDLVVATMTITRARKEMVDFSVPYFCSGHLMLVRRDSPIVKFADLDGKRVATIQGTTGDQVTTLLAPQAHRIEFTQNAEAVLAVRDRRVEAFVQDDVLLLAVAKQDASLKVVGWPPQMPAPYGIGVRKGTVDLLAAVNVALAQIRAQGIYGRLFNRWFGVIAKDLVLPGRCPPELQLP